MAAMLIHGDCLEVLPTLPDASVNFVFADLPYGVTANRWDTCLPLGELWPHLLRVGTLRCVYAFTATQPFATSLINSNSRLFRYDLVWDKGVSGSFGAAKHMPLPIHEGIYIFGARGSLYQPQMTLRDKPVKVTAGRSKGKDANTRNNRSGMLGREYTHKYPSSILAISSRSDARRLHRTQKPVALLEWLIRTYTHEGDTVLDPTAGSGSTAIAASNTGRKWVCIEKDASCHAVAAKRIAEHEKMFKQGQTRVCGRQEH